MPFVATVALPDVRQVKDPVPPNLDINALVAAVRELQNAGLLDVLSAKQLFVQTSAPLKFIPSDTEPTLAGPEEMWIQTNGDATPEAGYSADRLASTCYTTPIFFTNGTLTLTNGSINAALAVNKETKTYTTIRTHIAAQTTAATDLFLGVWAADGTLLGATANLATTAAAGAMLSAPLVSPLTISASVPVFLGISVIGGSGITVLRSSVGGGSVTGATTTFAAVVKRRTSWTVTGSAATSAAPAALSGVTNSVNLPWIELV